MKIFLLLLCFLFGIGQLHAQDVPDEYDGELAKSLGADEYGMKMYVLVLLKSGPTKVEDQETINKLFRGHQDNMARLVEEGKLVVAGPLAKNDKEYRGIFILNVPTKEEAEALMQTDPAIKEGVFAVELYGWYGSAALPVYLETHGKIEKKKP